MTDQIDIERDHLKYIDLVDVRLQRIEATTDPNGQITDTDGVGFDPIAITYRVVEGQFQLKCDSTVEVRSAVEGVENAEISFTLLMDFSTRNGDEKIELSDEQVSDFARESGLRLAFPYIREAIQSTSLKMGLPQITTGLLLGDEILPRQIWTGSQGFAAEDDPDSE